MFGVFRRRAQERQRLADLYAALATQARAPVFYAELGVPDTVDGRFDLLVLHAWLVMHRLDAEPESGTLWAALGQRNGGEKARHGRGEGQCRPAAITGTALRLSSLAGAVGPLVVELVVAVAEPICRTSWACIQQRSCLPSVRPSCA